jgi:phosphonate transport system substrate-binding protein
MKRTTFAAAALTLLFIPLLAAAEPPRVSIGVTAKNAEAAEKDFAGIFKHLRNATEVKFDIQVFTTYEALYDAFKSKKLDSALVGAVKYAQAHHETGAIPIISEGGPVRAMIVVARSSPLKSAAQLKGKRFGFGYRDSTSTHLIPLLLLSKNQVREPDLKAEFIGTDQEKIVARLLAGETDAVGVVEPVYRRYADKLRVLEQSDPFPGSPLIVQKTANKAMVEAVRKVFLSYKPGEGTRFLGGATKVDDTNFNQIRFLCRVLYGKTYV